MARRCGPVGARAMWRTSGSRSGTAPSRSRDEPTSAFAWTGRPPVCSAAVTEADLVFRNGAVYTVDAARRWAQAVAVNGGRVRGVGGEGGAPGGVRPPTPPND